MSSFKVVLFRKSTPTSEKGFQVVDLRIGRRIEVDKGFVLPAGEWKIRLREPDANLVKFVDDWCELRRRELQRQIITTKFEIVHTTNPSLCFRLVAHDRIVKPSVFAPNLIKMSSVRDPEYPFELDFWRKYLIDPFDKMVTKSRFNEPEAITIDDDATSDYLLRIQELTLMNMQLNNRIAEFKPIDPQMINPYVAKIVVKSVMSENCPVNLEPFSNFDEFAVAICGHVCCSEVKVLDKCPVCRSETKWQILKKSDIM